MATSRTLICLATLILFAHHITAAPNHTANSGLQTIAKPFHAPGRTAGTTTFSILPDPDPSRYGVPLLNFNLTTPDHTLGFPTAYGKVSSPNSLGYASYYGWLQIVRVNSSNTTAQLPWTVDILPTFQGTSNPFVSYGSEPTLFDHPFPIGDSRELDMSARSFLAYLPNPDFGRMVVPLVGFEWGYWVCEGRPVVKELRSLDLGVWNEHLGLFRGNYTSWNFTEVS